MKKIIKKLDIENFREYLSNLQKSLDITNIKEMEMFEYIEDSYNYIEDDEKALLKTFNKLRDHTNLNFEEKMFASMLLLLCHIKTEQERKRIEDNNRRHYKKILDNDEEDLDDDDDE